MPALEYVAGESMTSSEFSADSEQNWPWPESLDALVAARDNHAILFENEEVRVIRTRVLPGHLVPLHTQRWPCVLFILGWSHLIYPIWQEPPPPHSLENVGGTEMNTIQAEIKTTR
jgi:hypothetical protein